LFNGEPFRSLDIITWGLWPSNYCLDHKNVAYRVFQKYLHDYNYLWVKGKREAISHTQTAIWRRVSNSATNLSNKKCCFCSNTKSLHVDARWLATLCVQTVLFSVGKKKVTFRPHYDPGVDTASNRNEYQEYFLGGKCGRCVGLTTLPHSGTDCLEIWGASTYWNPQGLSRSVMGLLYLC